MRISKPLLAPLLLAVLISTMTACSDGTPATAPQDAAPMQPLALKAPSAALDAFVAAQGTYCDADVLPCNPDFPDIGYVIGLWEEVGAPFMVIDAWGVNTRWWNKHFAPIHPPFEYEGAVSEHPTNDGRRHITVHVSSRNTFTTLYDSDFLTVVLGADFAEYPGVSPIGADATASVDFIVPANYIGYPDLMEVAFAPKPGMEMLRYALSTSTVSTLRTDFQGIPAGTLVKASIRGTWLVKHFDIKGKARGLVRADYAPGTVLQVTPVKK